jgi:hypothetical protein
MVQSLYKDVEGIIKKPETKRKRLGKFLGIFSKYVTFSQEEIHSISGDFAGSLEDYLQNYPKHGEIKIEYETETLSKKGPAREVKMYTRDLNIYIKLDCWNPDFIKARFTFESDNRNDTEEYKGLVELFEKYFPYKPRKDSF